MARKGNIVCRRSACTYCEALARSGHGFSFSLRLGDGFVILLEASDFVNHSAKHRRSPSYYRRQEWRRAALLERKGKLVADSQGSSAVRAAETTVTLQDDEGSGDDNDNDDPAKADNVYETSDNDEDLGESLQEIKEACASNMEKLAKAVINTV